LSKALAAVVLAWTAPRSSRWRVGLLILWLLLPIGVALAVSFRKPIFYPRYLIVCLPALVLLVAAGLEWLRPRLLWGLALAALLSLSVSGLRAAYGTGYAPRQEYLREATRYIVTNAHAGDRALFYHPFSRVAFEYYRRALPARDDAPRVVYPLRGDGAVVASATASQWKLLAPDSPLMSDLARQQRVWFLLSVGDDEKSRTLQSWLAQHFPHVQPHDFGSTRLFLYSK
jgi:hypothetical protein